MAESKSSGGGSWLGNPNALLAIITIAGGVWLVSHELTSDRPLSAGGDTEPFAGDQKMEARLWEDPFKSEESGGARNGRRITIDLAELTSQVTRKANRQTPCPDAGPAVLLLPVMISGGQYSEDQESRIRSRYAVVSALGQSDYVPDDAEHIGVMKAPWLTQDEIQRARKSDPVVSVLWDKQDDCAGGNARLLGIDTTKDSPQLSVRYEWYRPRTFGRSLADENCRPWVLVLWLDDSYFEDEPLLRLALLLEPLIPAVVAGSKASPGDVALIGPRRSSTLRAMLPDWKTGRMPLEEIPRLECVVRGVLGRITLYNATASAMDEVLVRNPANADSRPRAAVGEALVRAGFGAFHNFAATDAQMADEVLKELELRGVVLQEKKEEKKNHIVLISEWDTFYARMLSLTYGAAVALRDSSGGNAGLTRAKFVEDRKVPPENFHSFVYLRGLDGQTVGGAGRDSGGKRGSGDRAVTLEELPRWKPDVNKSEGQAQFDYLGRLGDRVAELQATLKSRGEGELKAIGIVGSDVYDTLLILQALRRRFTGVLFFTTDLDVRFFHPHERDWARNLIIVSSYGLSLDATLQDPIAPFRDSTQTAQFAAALAALGKEELRKIERIPPRRFEVGNSMAVDLSVADPTYAAAPVIGLHPPTGFEAYRARSKIDSSSRAWEILALLLFGGGAVAVSEWLRRRSWRPFAFTEEDIGGPDGAHALLRGLAGLSDDPLAVALLAHPRVADLRAELKSQPSEKPRDIKTPDATPAEKVPMKVNWKREDLLAELVSVFVGQFNRLLTEGNRAGDPKTRVRLDELLDAAARVPRPPPPAASEPSDDASREAELAAKREAEFEDAACAAAGEARRSAAALFRLRRRRWRCFWICGAVFGLTAVGLMVAIHNDILLHDTGEPFSLTSGTSAWPASIVRLIALALAVWFGFTLRHRNYEAFLILTRMFRFSDPAKKGANEARGKVESGSRVCAEDAWGRYRRSSELRHRWYVVGGAAALYFAALLTLSKVCGGSISNPIRGDLIEGINKPLLFGSVIGFMLVGFLAVDKAVLCRRFIKELSAARTRYPITTCRHFARQKGRINDEYLDEWIDLQLIAELTERVGRMIYYPTILVLLLMLARNSWWDAWPWPLFLLVVFVFNFGLALTSLIILQRAAKSAKSTAEQSLAEKVRQLKARNEPSAAANDAAREEELLEEVQTLNRGAFVPFWENPVVGAIFLSSGGTTALQLLIWFMAR